MRSYMCYVGAHSSAAAAYINFASVPSEEEEEEEEEGFSSYFGGEERGGKGNRGKLRRRPPLLPFLLFSARGHSGDCGGREEKDISLGILASSWTCCREEWKKGALWPPPTSRFA